MRQQNPAILRALRSEAAGDGVGEAGVLRDDQGFRRSLAAFATGVTVITILHADGRPAGITINSFNSLSLAPPLVLWSLGTGRHLLDVFLGAGHYAVNVLAEQQEPLSRHFSNHDHAFDFASVPYEVGPHGVPILSGCCACLLVRSVTSRRFGDHYLMIGEAEESRRRPLRPLVFFGGQYHRLGAS